MQKLQSCNLPIVSRIVHVKPWKGHVVLHTKNKFRMHWQKIHEGEEYLELLMSAGDCWWQEGRLLQACCGIALKRMPETIVPLRHS